MLFTRKGDGGTSGLYGTGERLPKDSSVFEALGTLDELNSLLGVCYAAARKSEEEGAAVLVRAVQETLFIIQAELAGARKAVEERAVDALEGAIGGLEKKIENPHSFVIAGETELAALFDYARAVSRRAERRVIAADPFRPVSPATRKYLNRLSSLLYALARSAAASKKAAEKEPSY